MRVLLAPIRWIVRVVDWFEHRGRYVPGEDDQPISPWKDFAWVIAAWLVTVGVVIVFFAAAS